MKKPVLVIMAAGMGSRYGGLKQIDSVDAQGHIIIDFSIYDAVRAGFEKVVFIIKEEIEKDFKETIGNRISEIIDVEYVFQEVYKIPENFTLPEDRKKPWGTGHAILCCKDCIDGPFAVINADDYYGCEAFEKFLTKEMPLNPLKSEFFLPTVVQQLLKTDRAEVKVLESKDKWFGVTYKEDKQKVVEAIVA